MHICNTSRRDGILDDHGHAGVVHVDTLHLRPALSSNILGLSGFLIEGLEDDMAQRFKGYYATAYQTILSVGTYHFVIVL